MPNQPVTTFRALVKERKEKQQGIDFPRAYRALIKGFIRAKTIQSLNTSHTEQDNR